MKVKRQSRVLYIGILLSLISLCVMNTPAMAQSLTVSPTSVQVDSLIQIQGNGFVPGASYKVYLAFDTSYEETRTGTVDPNGDISESFWIQDMPADTYVARIETPTASGTAFFNVVPEIDISDTRVEVGEEIRISGTGFRRNRTIVIEYDGVRVGRTETDTDGTFNEVTFSVPESEHGNHSVNVSDGSFDVSGDLYVDAAIKLVPDSGSTGTQVEVQGTGFWGSRSVEIDYSGGKLDTRPSSIETDDRGSFTASFSVPGDFDRTENIKASDGNYNADSEFTLLAGIILNPPSGVVGTKVRIDGTGFDRNNNIKLFFDSTPIGDTESDNNGDFTVSVAVPENEYGDHTISASDGSNTAEAIFEIMASVSISPESGKIGSRVDISGVGFRPNKSVTIRFDGTLVASTASDSKGEVHDVFEVPQGYDTGNYSVTASDGQASASTTFTVTVTASITPTNGHVGTLVTVRGSGFSGPVTVEYDGKAVAQATADSEGKFVTSFEVPPSEHGNHTVTITSATQQVRNTFTMESEPPSVPAIISPVNGDGVDQRATFLWGAVNDPSGVTYTLQVSRSGGFASLVLEKEGLTETEYKLSGAERLMPTASDEPYYWRVRAVDGASNTSSWSSVGSFYVRSLPVWVRNTLIALGALLLALLVFWLGMKAAKSRK